MTASSERRIVAVLFAEAEGLSAAAESAGAEAGAALVDALFRRFRAAIEARGGTVDKFVGEGVMAVFGAPVAHGDDAARACLAGMAIRRDIEAFAKERSLDLAARVGVNAGEVLWAGVAGERPTAMGDAVNVAQRLQGEAKPGRVLVSAAVEALSRRRVRFGPAGEVKVRGRSEPVRAFEAVGEAEHATSPFAAVAAPIIGRDAELGGVREAIASGRGVFLRVEGDPGIGKTRFLLELREDAEKRGATLWGRGPEGVSATLAAPGQALRSAARRDGAPSLVLWLQAAFEAAGGDALDAENRAHLVALSVGESVPAARVAALEPARRLEETRFAWESWFRLRCARGPVTLFLDDLHAPDAETATLLEALAARLAGLPLAVLVASRPGGRRLAGFRDVPLGPLPEDAAARVASGAFSRTPSAELVAFVVGRAAGNAYAVLELARHLEEARLATGDPLRLVGAAEGIPTGLQALLQARLDGLGTAVKETLKAASVIGRTFWAGPLARLTGRDPAAALAEGERLGIVMRHEDSTLPGEDEFSFKDALVGEAAYGLLPRRDRSRLHEVAAEQLEALRPRAGRRAAALAAAHRLAASEATAAAHLWLDAAREAGAEGLAEEALAYAVEARHAVENRVTRLAVARFLISSLRCAEGEPLAMSIAQEPGVTADEVTQVELLLASARASQGDLEGALAIARRVLEGRPAPHWEFEALHGASFSLFHLGRFEEALPLVTRMESMDLRSHPRTLSRGSPDDARITRAQILQRSGDLDGSERILRELVEGPRAAAPESGTSMIVGLNLGNIAFLRGRVDAAESEYRRVLGIASRLGDRQRVFAALQNLSNIYFSKGDFRRALDADREVERRRTEAGEIRTRGSTLVNLGASNLMLGDEAEASRILLEALAACRASGDAFNEAIALTYLGEVAWRGGKVGEARDQVDAALAIIEPRKFQPLLAAALHHRARLGGATSDFERGIAAAKGQADPRAESVCRSGLAVRRAEEGRVPEAQALVGEALALAPESTACSERMVVLEDAVRVHRAAGAKERADEALVEALALAAKSGAKGVERRLRELEGGRGPGA